jgi:hypothetical protein
VLLALRASSPSFLNNDVCESNVNRAYDVDLYDSDNLYCDLVPGPT